MRNIQKPGLPHLRDFPSNLELWYPLNLHHTMQMGSCMFFPGKFEIHMGILVQVGRFSVPVSSNLEFELTNTFIFLLLG